jgi:hypothetical protein
MQDEKENAECEIIANVDHSCWVVKIAPVFDEAGGIGRVEGRWYMLEIVVDAIEKVAKIGSKRGDFRGRCTPTMGGCAFFGAPSHSWSTSIFFKLFSKVQGSNLGHESVFFII